MSSGDAIEAGRVTTAESTTSLLGAVPSEQDVDFNGTVILSVFPQPGALKPNITLDGIHGVGNNGAAAGGASPGGTGVVGFGGPNHGTGVVGKGGGVNGIGGIGVHGIGGSQFSPTFSPGDPPGAGVVAQGGRMPDDGNETRLLHGTGVIAIAGGNNKPLPPATDTGSVGVFAQGAEADFLTVNVDGVDTINGPTFPGAGVVGRGSITRSDNGVLNGPLVETGARSAGVVGIPGGHAVPTFAESANNGVFGKSESGSGVAGVSPRNGFGVSGRSEGNHAVFGDNRSAPITVLTGTFGRTSGCYGVTLNNRGVSGVVGLEDWTKNKPQAIDDYATGVFGQAGLFVQQERQLTAKGFAGIFLGPVVTWGPFVNYGGPKSAAVPHPDGSHRLLYCLESPESWFEDFGEAKLVKGKAAVRIDKDFAGVAKTDAYHVFLSPYGESKGLYVSRRVRNGFEVREQSGGRSTLAFSYRVVARRKDVPGERLPKFDAPPQIVKALAKLKTEKPKRTKRAK